MIVTLGSMILSLTTGLAFAQTPASAARPSFAGTWAPADPARSDQLFDVGLASVPGRGQLTIEQRPDRLTVTITMPDDKLDPLLSINGRFYTTIVYRLSEPGRSGGAGAGAVPPSTGWVGNTLVLRNARPSARTTWTTFSLDGDRLKMETRVEVNGQEGNTVAEVFTRIK